MTLDAGKPVSRKSNEQALRVLEIGGDQSRLGMVLALAHPQREVRYVNVDPAAFVGYKNTPEGQRAEEQWHQSVVSIVHNALTPAGAKYRDFTVNEANHAWEQAQARLSAHHLQRPADFRDPKAFAKTLDDAMKQAGLDKLDEVHVHMVNVDFGGHPHGSALLEELQKRMAPGAVLYHSWQGRTQSFEATSPLLGIHSDIVGNSAGAQERYSANKSTLKELATPAGLRLAFYAAAKRGGLVSEWWTSKKFNDKRSDDVDKRLYAASHPFAAQFCHHIAVFRKPRR